ncbi:hypothetical protein QOZ80_4BG0336860 [Eleusine coracana subsp. coracana]|nr:hypothetical protein QOZ80_4BG0336860 [Eleusine coracana subsp. coracana]
MEDRPGEAAADNQVHGWSSYSLPSQPPDIRNWFASYQYESPEDSELIAVPGPQNGSETQDPLERLIFPQDDGVALRKNSLRGQRENQVFDRQGLVPADENESTIKKPPKRKQSLRALFGFLDKHDETTESEFQLALPVHRNAPEPLPICNATGLLDANHSQEGAINQGKVPVDCNGISSVDTQVYSPTDQEVEYSKLPDNFVSPSLADNRKCFPKDDTDNIEHGNILVDCEGISSVETQVSSPANQELECSKLPDICDSPTSADIQRCLPEDIENSKVAVYCDGISSVDTQVSSPADQEAEHSKPVVPDLGDIQSFFQEDGIDSVAMAINSFATNPGNTEKGSQNGSDHNRPPVCRDRIILADTKENSPNGNRHCKPASDSKGSEKTVASDGFIAVKRKHKPPEECKTNKIPKYPTRGDKAALQENRNMPGGHKVLAQVHPRSPLADRSNFPEAAAAAPTAEFSGKWKCPSRSKPHVGPPMKQLRLDRWLC